MRPINPKCTNKESFKYSILISLHYFDLKYHPERIKPLKTYEDKYNFTSSEYFAFENNNPCISLTVYDEYEDRLHKSINSTNNKAYIVKMNNHRYHAIKPNKDKYIKLKEVLNLFTHKELNEYILNKVIR